MIIAGFGLVLWAFAGKPGDAMASRAADSELASTQAPAQSADAEAAPLTVPAEAGMASDAPSATPTPTIQLPVSFGAGAPAGLIAAAESVVLTGAQVMTTTGAAPVRFDAVRTGGDPAYQVTFAAATRFDTIDTSLTFTDVRGAWASETITYTALAVLTDTLPLLEQVLGDAGASVAGYATVDEVVAAAWQDRTTLALLPFDQLEPRLVVMAVDGQNPVENASGFDAQRYPLVADVFVHLAPANEAEAALVSEFLGALPSGNREPGELTVLAMTGVTAMCRMTAAQMDLFGPAWPAEIVGPGLASADITHISNEVPFVEGCETNTSQENYNFCSKPEYMETLIASGADIIGMTGNHQNDFGRQNAMASLEYYDEYSLPYYGGGKNLEEAMKPLFIEHNGTRLAFLGTNSYGPKMAWATDSLPGAAPFDLNILSATIRSIKEKDLADVVLVELQYQESYDTEPLAEQRIDFNALVRAGADIVTGVQSHVPQGMEFSDESMILYGLGNLYFDQMGPTTREGMVARHTFYAGRHISTQIQTTVVYDYGQPHWTTPAERASMLRRVFAASYW
ncbi:MAG: CapA family protein [Caldilineaceae bacterium]|nr:CapA family protein [Caldilineaceae bacterium]